MSGVEGRSGWVWFGRGRWKQRGNLFEIIRWSPLSQWPLPSLIRTGINTGSEHIKRSTARAARPGVKQLYMLLGVIHKLFPAPAQLLYEAL